MWRAARASARSPIQGRGARLSPGASLLKPSGATLALSRAVALRMPGALCSSAAIALSPESWLRPWR
eukprot:1839180-Pyramimonas_sp.AAC.1